ncbi:uncharacterized protein P884DRAFT_272659 [Thermothelomyces heterothallicus CBS 202.75]|uniref:uncharacterized protein n=1 Tax=Thermothelomyces heterothallicus CBS 202.75 TaxID=1149848 RepID=UPI00374454BE
MACICKVDWEAIESAAAAIKPAKSSSVLRGVPAIWPTPDNDIVFSDYVSLTGNGSFTKSPILLGATPTTRPAPTKFPHTLKVLYPQRTRFGRFCSSLSPAPSHTTPELGGTTV